MNRMIYVGVLFGFLSGLGYIGLLELLELDFPFKYHIGMMIIMMIFMMGIVLGMGLNEVEKK
jgi:hypothetical protein